MSHRRLEVLQWYALFGGALAWAGQHVLGYFVSAGTCSAPVAHWGLNGRLWLALLAAAGLAGVVAAQASAFVVFRATSGVGHDDPGPEGRLHFFAVAALVGNVLFFFLVGLDGLGSLYHLPCAQS